MAEVDDGAASRELSGVELRENQLAILAEFDRWCRSHSATYYLTYGTLLGAVRHGGFIPWDDDVDVMMPRADYDRLCHRFHRDAPPCLEVASAPSRAEWPLPYAKVWDNGTELREPLADPVRLGVNIDVFPVDPLPRRGAVRRVQALALAFLRWAIELHYIEPQRGRGWHGPLAIDVARPLIRLLPIRVLVAADTWVARHPGKPSGQVGVRVGSFDWSVAEAALGAPVDIEFEGLLLCGPRDPDAVLTELYGDYRTLPPVQARVSHHAFTAWRRE
jgi:lipopolysaccharide cholinephosphotransferase